MKPLNIQNITAEMKGANGEGFEPRVVNGNIMLLCEIVTINSWRKNILAFQLIPLHIM